MRPPQPIQGAQAAQEFNTHQIEFLDKVAPYNSGEAAWFPRHVAEARCMAGVAKPLLFKDAQTEEILGTWDLSDGQKMISRQMTLTRSTGAGDYQKQLAEEDDARRKEERKVEAEAARADAKDKTGAFSRARSQGTAAPTPESSESAEGK